MVDSVVAKLKQRGVVVVQFLRLLLSRFVEDQGLPNAASLTFTTLLSLVPLMTGIIKLTGLMQKRRRIPLELKS